MSQKPMISGFVKSGFEGVQKAFAENFEFRNELGAACCVYHRGKKVVDLWGGIRNEATEEPWEEDTMVIVFSTTKGLSGLAMAVAHSQGLFDYDECISAYWPEFAQQGKENITIRHLLAHQAGLFAFDELGDRTILTDFDKLAIILARQKPAWKAGTRQTYHALTLGYYQNEFIRRVDPKHRSIAQFFQEEIADPLGIDFYIRLPEEIPNSRLATLRRAKMGVSGMRGMPFSLILAAMYPRSAIRRSLVGSLYPLDDEHIYARNFEVPSGGGVGTARAIACAYSAFATGGKELGLRNETLQKLMAPPIPSKNGFHDSGLKVEIPFSLGFAKPSVKNPWGSPSSFGFPGSGGSFGFADPQNEIGYGYVLNGMGTSFLDPRDTALRTAMYKAIGIENPYISTERTPELPILPT